MEFIFWFSTGAFVIQGFYKFFLKKDFFNIFTYVFLGIYIPLFLFFLNWSNLIYNNISPEFYSIFIYLNIFIMISNLIDSGSYVRKLNFHITRRLKNNTYIFLLNIIYFILFILENYIGSGFFFPALRGIDIHTYWAPGISYLTGSLFAILALNFLYYYKSKRKIYIFWIVFFLLLPIFSKASRMIVVVSFVQLISFIIFIHLNSKQSYNSSLDFLRKKRYIIIIIIIIFIFILSLAYLTEYRWGDYGNIKVSYSDSIRYTGPSILGDVISVYYGYFPLSFNNLNVNIIQRNINHNYIGLYSYKSIYYGLFRLHNIFGINLYKPREGGFETSGSSTVPTGFFDFYYDYGELVFIPILFGILIYLFLKIKTYNKKSLVFYGLYFYWVPLWFFMSFQNVIYSGQLIIRAVILSLLLNLFFKVKN